MKVNKTYFDTRYSYNPDRIKVWKAICEYLQKYIDKNASILEIGAGYCDFINQIKASRKVALDIDENAVKYCAKDVEFLNDNIFNFKYNQKFDIIFASNFFEHFTITELQEIVGNLKTHLNDHGKIILIQPNYYYCYKNYWDDYTHKTVFTHNNLPDFLKEHGFETEVIKKKFLPFSFKSKLPTSYFLTKLYLISPVKPLAKQLLIIAKRDV